MNRTITNTAVAGALGRLSHRLRRQALSLIRAGSALARRKTIRVLGVMGSIAAASVLIAAPAGATIQKSSALNYGGTTCAVYAYLDQYGNSFSAAGQVPCATRYAKSGLYAALQWWNGSTGRWTTVQQGSTVFTNSYGTGSHTLWSGPYYPQTGHGCAYWRAEVQAEINNYGIVTVDTPYQEHCQ